MGRWGKTGSRSTPGFVSSTLEQVRPELVARGEEGAVREQPDQDGRDGDAPEKHVEDHYLQPRSLQGVRPGDDHTDHRPRQEDDARRLRGVYERDHGAPERGLEDRRDGLAAGGS